MSRTVLSLLQDAAIDLSLVSPTSLDTSLGDPTTNKLIRQLHRTCRYLAGRADWQKLRREKTFTASAAAAQSTALPTDFLRFVPNTFYNRSRNRRVLGPLTSAQWQNVQASLSASSFEHYYQRGNSILITPTPSGSDSMAYEYITSYLGTNAAGSNERESFTLTDDVTYFDDELVILGIVWAYRKAEGLDYGEDFRAFELRLADVIKQDGGRRVIDMAGSGGYGNPFDVSISEEAFNSEFSEAFY